MAAWLLTWACPCKLASPRHYNPALHFRQLFLLPNHCFWHHIAGELQPDCCFPLQVGIVPLAAGSKPPVMGSSLDLDWGSRSSSLDQTPQLQYGMMQVRYAEAGV